MKRAKRAGSVEILIDELILTGFDAKDRFVIGDALQSELIRLVSEQGVPPGLMNGAGSLGPVSFRAARIARPGELGSEIARSVYRGFEE